VFGIVLRAPLSSHRGEVSARRRTRLGVTHERVFMCTAGTCGYAVADHRNARRQEARVGVGARDVRAGISGANSPYYAFEAWSRPSRNTRPFIIE